MGASNHPGLKHAKPRARVLDEEDAARAAKAGRDPGLPVIDREDPVVCDGCSPARSTGSGGTTEGHTIDREGRLVGTTVKEGAVAGYTKLIPLG